MPPQSEGACLCVDSDDGQSSVHNSVFLLYQIVKEYINERHIIVFLWKYNDMPLMYFSW